MGNNKDIIRLRNEYAIREQKLINRWKYSLLNKSELFTYQQRQKAILSLLEQLEIKDLSVLKVLELGCGNGNVLTELLVYGFNQKFIHGIDLLFSRLRIAKNNLPTSIIINSDGQFLPYKKFQFDLILQFTAFSSILDTEIKQEMASEMLRVVKPTGSILWYDFWFNPTNKQTKGITEQEIRDLFPNCNFRLKKITLAPPIARIVVPFSWPLGITLESIKILNSHYIALIKPYM